MAVKGNLLIIVEKVLVVGCHLLLADERILHSYLEYLSKELTDWLPLNLLYLRRVLRLRNILFPDPKCKEKSDPLVLKSLHFDDLVTSDAGSYIDFNLFLDLSDSTGDIVFVLVGLTFREVKGLHDHF